MSKCRDGRRNNRTPAESQFKPGKSGNQKGRPQKPPPTLIELIGAELNSKHLLDVGGRQVELPLKTVLIRQFLRLASKGHPKALIWALEMMELVQRSEVKRHAPEKPYERIRREDLSKMSEKELHELYAQTFEPSWIEQASNISDEPERP